jgi:hypothetical protein
LIEEKKRFALFIAEALTGGKKDEKVMGTEK